MVAAVSSKPNKRMPSGARSIDARPETGIDVTPRTSAASNTLDYLDSSTPSKTVRTSKSFLPVETPSMNGKPLHAATSASSDATPHSFTMPAAIAGAAVTTKDEMESLLHTSTRAATSSPLPPQSPSLSQLEPQDVGVREAASLATEILPAPPTLPYDPSYPPLNPQTVPLPPFTSAGVPLPVGSHASADLTLDGQPQSSPTVHPSVPTLSHPSSSDKKRKQPAYSLATPNGYDGKMPWPLFAIVSGRSEAHDRRTGRGKSRRGGSKAFGSSVKEDRNSRSATPSAAVSHSSQNVDAQLECGFAPAQSKEATTLKEDGSHDATSNGVLSSGHAAVGTGPDAVGFSPETETLSAREATMSAPNGDGPSGARSDSSEVDATNAAHIASLHSLWLGAEDHDPNPFPVAAHSGGQILDRDVRQAGELDLLPNTITTTPSTISDPTGGKAAHITHGVTPKSSKKKKKELDEVPTPQMRPAIAPNQRTRLNVEPMNIMSMTTEDSSTTSRASSPLSREEGPDMSDSTTSILDSRDRNMPSRHMLSLSSSSSIPAALAAGGGSRPTRAAVAKVVARGSYYDAAAYEAKRPMQAAIIKDIHTPPKSTSANRRVNESTNRGAMASSSSVTDTPMSADIPLNGKGKGKETDDFVDGGLVVDDAPLNDDHCSTCLGTGHFICCDSCPRSFHFACVNPPLDINEVPLDDDSEWHCRACSAQRRGNGVSSSLKTAAGKQQRKRIKGNRFFNPLVAQLEAQNPTIFSLPPDIKSFFKHVGSSAVDGLYQDTGRQRAVKADRKGVIDERDPYRLKDAKGREILCYQCGQSALPKDCNPRIDTDPTPTSSWRRMVSCDYCTLHWHLDCLDPPLSSVPSSFHKWRCPCHIEDLLLKTRTAKAATQLQIVDLPIPTLLNTGLGPGKVYRPRVLNSGVIDIVPDPMDTYFSAASSSYVSGRGLQPGWMSGGRVDVPPLVDGEVPGGGMRRVKFRLPERVVRTDWWMKVLSGGRDSLLNGEKKGGHGMDLLAAIAQDELVHQGESRKMVQLALNGSSGPSLRIQPLASFTKPQDPPRKGFVPHEGGKLKREEDEQWQESAMRGSLHLVDDEEDPVPTLKAEADGGNQEAAAPGLSPSSESELTDLSDVENGQDEAVPIQPTKRIKLVHKASSSPAPSNSISQEELDSLMAVRELMRKKGEGELMMFLMSG